MTLSANQRHPQTGRPSELQLLLSFASMLYLYRKLRKALGILYVAEHIFPQDRRILEFKVVILVEMRRYSKVIQAINDLESLGEPLPLEVVRLKRQTQHILRMKTN